MKSDKYLPDNIKLDVIKSMLNPPAIIRDVEDLVNDCNKTIRNYKIYLFVTLSILFIIVGFLCGALFDLREVKMQNQILESSNEILRDKIENNCYWWNKNE